MAQEYRFIITADDSQMASSFDNINRHGQSTADTLASGFKAAAVTAAAAWGKDKFLEIFEVFKEFDDGSKQIKAFASATSEQMSIIEARAQSLAPEFGKTATEVLGGMGAMKQGGASLIETISDIDDVMALAAGANMQMADSADKLTDEMNTFKELKSSAEAVDIMTTAITNGALVQEEYFEAMKKAGPVLSGYGLTLRDVSAQIMALAEGGIKGSIAATGLNNAYARLLKPTGDAVGILEKYNFTAVDSTGKTKKLADMIDELAEKGLTDKEKLEIFGMYAGPALSSLLKRGGDSIRKYDELLANVDGTGQKVAETMQSGVGGASRRAGADLQNGIIKAMKEFEPAIKGVLSLTQYFDAAIDNLSGTIKTGAAGLTAAAGVLTNIGAAAEYVTDSLGITDETTTKFADATEQAFGSAKDLLQQAASAYDGVDSSIVKAKESSVILEDQVSTSIKNIAANTGLAISSWGDLEEAVASGAITWEEASAASVKSIDHTQQKLSELNAQQEQAAESQAKYAKAIEDIFKASGASAAEYYSTQTEAINKQAAEYEKLGIAKVDVEKWANAEILKLHEKEQKSQDDVIKSFYNKTNAVTGTSLLAKAGDLEASVSAWEEAGISIEDINKGMYEKITSLMKQALTSGNEQVYVQLESMRNSYSGFTSGISDDTEQAVEDINKYFGDIKEPEIKINTNSFNESLTEIELQIGKIAKDKINLNVSADIDSLEGEISKIRSSIDTVDSIEGKVKIDADIQSAKDKLSSILTKVNSTDGKSAEVKVTADTSEAEASIDRVSSSLADLGEGGVSFNRSSIDGLKAAIDELNATPTLDPFRAIRDGYEQDLGKMEKLKDTYLSVISEINSSGLGDEMGDTVDKYQDEINTMMGINDGRSKEEKEAEREIAKVKKKIWEEETDARKDAYKDQLDAQKKALEEQKDTLNDYLDSAEEQLDYAKDMQKAYWDDQLDQAKEYYAEVEQQRDDALERYKEVAEAEYDAAVNLLEKKKGLLQEELNAVNTHLNDLKQIYDESGEGGQQYYEAEADALSRRAQEMKENGTDQVLIEKWLADELKDLRDKAAEDGITGLDDYGEAIMRNYDRTGEFSENTKKLQDRVSELDEQLKALKEGGSDAFFDDAAFAALGFDQKLQGAQASIDNVEESIKKINGDNFDFAGQSAQSLANSVSNAQNRVDSLKEAIDRVGDSISAIGDIDVDAKFSGTYSESNAAPARKPRTPYSFLDLDNGINYSFDGGGYTWDGPRLGGLDGKGGRLALLHPREYVTDLTKNEKDSKITRDAMSVGVVNIYTTQKINAAQIKSELRKLNKRG